MKNIKEDMELRKKTKVQNAGAGSLTTTVPSFVRDVLSLEKGDTIEWHLYGDDNWTSSKIDEIYADPATQGITIRPNKLEELGYNFTPNAFKNVSKLSCF